MKTKTKRARALSSRACNFENESRNDVVCTLHTCFSSYMHFVEPWKTSQWEKFQMGKPHMAVSSTSCFSLRGSRLHHIGYYVAKIIKTREVCVPQFFSKIIKFKFLSINKSIVLSVTEKNQFIMQKHTWLRSWFAALRVYYVYE